MVMCGPHYLKQSPCSLLGIFSSRLSSSYLRHREKTGRQEKMHKDMTGEETEDNIFKNGDMF